MALATSIPGPCRCGRPCPGPQASPGLRQDPGHCTVLWSPGEPAPWQGSGRPLRSWPGKASWCHLCLLCSSGERPRRPLRTLRGPFPGGPADQGAPRPAPSAVSRSGRRGLFWGPLGDQGRFGSAGKHVCSLCAQLQTKSELQLSYWFLPIL